MSKQILAYGGYTATMIKNRAEIPLSADMSLGAGSLSATTVNCQNINMSLIKNTLGSSSTKLSELSLTPLVNKYSNFGPCHWAQSGTTGAGATLYAYVPSPYYMGSFAGYNHGALAPYILSDNRTDTLYSDATFGQYWIQASVLLGEVDWKSKAITIPPIKGIAMEWSVIGDAGSKVTQYIDFPTTDYLSDGIAGISYDFNFSATTYTAGYSSTRTGISRFYFCADSAHSHQELCAVPNLSGWTQTMTYRVAPIFEKFLYTGTTAGLVSYNSGGYSSDLNATTLSGHTNTNYLDPNDWTKLYVYWYGIDTNGNGAGDIDGRALFGNGHYYYGKKCDSGGTWQTGWVFLGACSDFNTNGLLVNQLITLSFGIFPPDSNTLTFGEKFKICVSKTLPPDNFG